MSQKDHVLSKVNVLFSGQGPKTFLEKMKEKFHIDLSKTVARTAESNRIEYNRLESSKTDRNVKPGDMTYEDMKKLALERSLQDKVMQQFLAVPNLSCFCYRLTVDFRTGGFLYQIVGIFKTVIVQYFYNGFCP